MADSIRTHGDRDLHTHGRELLLPLASGLAMPFAFPPYSVPALPFVGLVPLLLYFAKPRRSGAVAAGAAAFAVPFFLGTTYWLFLLARFTPAGAVGGLGVILLQLGTFLFFPVALSVTRHAGRVPFALAVPVLWTIAEHVRNFGELRFPWASLGYALADWPALVQHADLVGVHGVSLWLAAVNAMVACALFRGSSRRRRLTWILVATAATALPVLYGVWRTARVEARIESAPTVRVAILQPNIEQGLKWSPGARAETLRRVTGMIERGDRSGADFVLGPEAALPIIVSTGEDRLPDAVPAGSKPLLLGIVRGRGQPEEVVLPDGRRARRFVRHFNSAVLAGPDRRVLGAYDKQYLVAVTEQIPYRRVFGFFLPLLRKQFGRFDPGDSLEILQVPVGRRSVGVGATVCYESLFPVLSRRMVQDGAVLFANVTNDAWFGRSSMSYQHVGLLVLRAIENRRSVVRSANTGVSAWIDPAGRVRQRTRLDEAAMLVVDAPLLDGASIYCRVGDLTVYASYFAALWMLADCWRRHRRGITF